MLSFDPRLAFISSRGLFLFCLPLEKLSRPLTIRDLLRPLKQPPTEETETIGITSPAALVPCQREVSKLFSWHHGCFPQLHHTLCPALLPDQGSPWGGLLGLARRGHPWPLPPSVSHLPDLHWEFCFSLKAQLKGFSSMQPSLSSAAGKNRFFWTQQ